MRLPAVNKRKASELKLTKKTDLQLQWSWMSVYFFNYVASKSIS